MIDGITPTVSEVSVRGGAWTTSFLNHLAAQGLGSNGYSIPKVSTPANILPWTNLDRISIRFSEDVQVDQGDLRIAGVNQASYLIASMTYDLATFTATCVLATPIGADMLTVTVAGTGAGAVRDRQGNILDGNPAPDATGDYRLRFDVAPGDVDQSGATNVLDTVKTRNLQFTKTGESRYSPLHDVDGSGLINIFDTIRVGNNQFTALPDGGTGPIASTEAAAVRLLIENVTITSRASEPVEGFFDVYLEIAPGSDFSAAGYDVALRTPAGSGVTLVSAGPPSPSHPSLFPSEPVAVASIGALNVTDVLATGATRLDNGEGLFRVRFTVAPGTAGDVPISFNTTFTNLADANGQPLMIERVSGVITIKPAITTINGTDGNDTFHVVRSGSQLHIYQNTPPTGQPTHSIELASLGGTLTINALDGNDSLIVNTGGQPTLGLAQLIYNAGTGTNSLILENGSARIDSNVAAGGALNTTVAAGAQLTTSRLKQNGLTLGADSRVTVLPGGTQANVLTSLDLGTTGTLDLNDNDLVVNTTAAGKTAAFKCALQPPGRRLCGGWLEWKWCSQLQQPRPIPNTTLSLVDNAVLGFSTFGGEPVDANSLLVKYTYYGDIDQNGQVDADDLTVFANNFGRMSGATQVDGDIDFNGTVDADDLTVFANNFGRGVGIAVGGIAAEGRSTKDEGRSCGIVSRTGRVAGRGSPV